MLVEKKRLIELLYHEDERVKSAAAEALQKFFPGSGDVIEHLLKAMKTAGEKVITLASAIEYFVPTENDLHEILRLVRESRDEKNKERYRLHRMLKMNVMKFPVELLEKNYRALSFDKELVALYAVLKEREKLKRAEPNDLWEELVALCEQHRDKEMPAGAFSNAELLVDLLLENGEKIKDRVISTLSRTENTNFHLEDFMVGMAGKLKLEETVPHLFRIFKECDSLDYVYSLCITALGQIGTREVVKEIEALYLENEDLRSGFAEILEYIPYDYSEELAGRLLLDESDMEVRTFLAGALCDIFSIKNGEKVLDIIKKRQYDSSIMELLDYLIPVYVYHNESIDGLTELEKKDREFRDERFETSFFPHIRKAAEQLNLQAAADDEDEYEPPDIEESGEVDFSGNKKVVPMRRIPSKKRNKGKKKKRKIGIDKFPLYFIGRYVID